MNNRVIIAIMLALLAASCKDEKSAVNVEKVVETNDEKAVATQVSRYPLLP